MIQDIIKSIAKSLKTEFGADYAIYTENIEQGLKEPAFSIVHLETINEQIVGVRYERTYAFDVHYFAKDKINTKSECLDVAERLMVCLESINFVDNIYRMIKMNYEIVDGVLHFFVTYNPIVKRNVELLDNMESLTTTVGVNGGIENG